MCPKKRKPKAHAKSPSLTWTDVASVVWAMTVLTTLLCTAGALICLSIAASGGDRVSMPGPAEPDETPAERPQEKAVDWPLIRLLAALLQFAALVIGSIGLLLLVPLTRLTTPPPSRLLWGGALICVAPYLLLWF